MWKWLNVVFLAASISTSFAATEVDRGAINQIIDEGFHHSELAPTAQYLTDRIGGRLTNSPQMRAAEAWAQARFRAWGLKNVRAEGFEFGRGWSIERSSVRMMTPRLLGLRAIPVAWTPPTKGTISAPIIVAPLGRERDFEKWKGQLSGRIVLVTRPDEGSEPAEPPFRRYDAERLAELDTYQPPVESEVARRKTLKMAQFEARRDAFLAAEGALAWARMSYRDGGLLHGEGYGYKAGETPELPGVEIAAEDYRRLARLAKAGEAPVLEILSDVRFHDEDMKAYNILADIPGTDARAGYVMAGAHLDSWVAADGAQDNAAGSVIVMEAARILSKLGFRPRRTIRFALWNGEEQALLGSMAYVERHVATRAPLADAEQERINPYFTWRSRWPITPRPGHKDLVAYFNLDNGSGKLRGIHAEGNLAVVPIFQEWLAPFASMGAGTVAAAPTGGTDHVFMQAVGIPAFQFIQDPLDYDSRIHHSSLDSFDHLKLEDMRQASVILASFLLMAAQREEPLPRMPLPTKPNETNPYAYEDEEEGVSR